MNGRLSIAFHSLFLVFMLAPMLVVAWMSLTPSELLSLPLKEFSLRWYSALWNSGAFFSSIKISAVLALLAATLATALAIPVGYAFTRYDFPGKSVAEGLFLSPLIIPHVVLGVALLMFFSKAGLSGGWAGLLAAHVVVILPYALRLIIAGFSTFDSNIENAAASLGAGKYRIFFLVFVPVVFPSITGGWLISFIQSFDEVTMTVFLATPSIKTFPVELYHAVEDSVTPIVTAVSTLVIIATYVALLIVDRIYGLERLLVGKAS